MDNTLIDPYVPKKISFHNGELAVADDDFQEICDVGFFRIQRPVDTINIEPLRHLAKNFMGQTHYTTIGKLNEGNGFFGYEKAQIVRFVIADDYWDKEGWTTSVSQENPNLSKEIQQEAGNLRDFGVRILQGLLNYTLNKSIGLMERGEQLVVMAHTIFLSIIIMLI